MIKIGFKKNKKGSARTSSEKGGFALLFSVLISSLLLTIGLSIFNIALKELAISTASRQSIHAFYAADSGREYVKYLDTKKGITGLFDVTYRVFPLSDEEIYTGSVDSGDPSGPNYSATIQKKWHDGTFSKVDTTITVRGYDTDASDKMERAIRQDY